MRNVVAAGIASLVAGCVQPVYMQPGPVQLQAYPPPVSYRGTSDYRPPVGAPIPLQPAPVVQPLPPPALTPPPSATEIPNSDLGPIPVQDMPAPTGETAPISDAPAADTRSSTQSPTPSPEIVRKIPTGSGGNNVPLEGFRPMKGQTRPAP